MWGLFPLYWPLLEPAGAVEILAHRIAWSLVTMVVLLVALRRTAQLRAILRNRRVVLLLLLASVVIAFNWGGFIYGVNHHRVVEVSLGYFINPLVTVLLGVVVLSERLRPVQWLAIGVATLAVVVLTLDYGHPPWIAFLLAGSFATYGLAKKKAGVEAVESLTFETLVLTPLALGYLVWLSVRRPLALHQRTARGHAVLLATTGLVTAVPADLLRRRRDPDPDDHDRAAAVPRADAAVRARPARLPRADVAGEVGRFRPGLAGSGAVHRARRCGPASTSCGPPRRRQRSRPAESACGEFFQAVESWSAASIASSPRASNRSGSTRSRGPQMLSTAISEPAWSSTGAETPQAESSNSPWHVA